jgi:hypothetical protein
MTPVTEDIPTAAQEEQVELIDYLEALWSYGSSASGPLL